KRGQELDVDGAGGQFQQEVRPAGLLRPDHRRISGCRGKHGDERENQGTDQPVALQSQCSHSGFNALRTIWGTKAEMSPPICAIWRTNVAEMCRTCGLEGTKTVCRSGAICAFMPTICIS